MSTWVYAGRQKSGPAPRFRARLRHRSLIYIISYKFISYSLYYVAPSAPYISKHFKNVAIKSNRNYVWVEDINIYVTRSQQ